MSLLPPSLLLAARALIDRVRPPACAHQHLIFDSYRDVVTATCTCCGEMWVSSDGRFELAGRKVVGLA